MQDFLFNIVACQDVHGSNGCSDHGRWEPILAEPPTHPLVRIGSHVCDWANQAPFYDGPDVTFYTYNFIHHTEKK